MIKSGAKSIFMHRHKKQEGRDKKRAKKLGGEALPYRERSRS